MAGEWLKMECATPDKPEVLALTVKMGWDDPDLTVGKLFRLWRWFDQQTTDGNAAGVTPALLDRQVGVSGFIKAVAEVGWLVITDAGITLANFDRHNGATAKSRAQGAKRVANHKSNAKANATGNGESVSEALPREEKRREEKKINTERESSPRATRLPTDLTLPDDWSAFCQTERPDLDPAKTFDKFRDYWTAKAGKDGAKLDWLATWRNWVREERKQIAQRQTQPLNKQQALEERNRAVAEQWLRDQEASHAPV
jgi:hypothetical protein